MTTKPRKVHDYNLGCPSQVFFVCF